MCLAVAGFKKEARNWGQVLRYVKQTQGFISYYEGGK